MAINAKPLEIGRMEGLKSGTHIRHGPDQAVRSKEIHLSRWAICPFGSPHPYGSDPALRSVWTGAETATTSTVVLPDDALHQVVEA